MKLPVSLNVVLAVAGLGLASRSASAQPAPPADEPVPTFEIYGTLVPFLETARTVGATVAGSVAQGSTGASQVALYTGTNARGRGVMDVGTSQLGFRGGVSLMKDLSVVWQIESGVPVDGGVVANTIASRNSNLGVTGSWGTLFYGNWDTPYKQSTGFVNPIKAGFLPDYNGILHQPGFGVNPIVTQPGRAAAAADAAFYRRVGNSVQYWTPVVSGFSARLAYGSNETRTTRTTAIPSISPTILSGHLAFDQGPIKLRYSVELHLDYFGMTQLGGSAVSNTNTSSTDQGHEVVAQYTHAAPGFDTRVVGIFEYLKYKSDDTTVPAAGAGPANQFSRSAFYGLIDQTLMGKHHIWATFGLATAGSCALAGGAACTTIGLGATAATVGYIYRASKTTDFFAAAYRITNDTSATYTSPGLGGTAAAGADTEAFGIGMWYQFGAKLGGPPAKPPAAKAPAPEPAPAPAPTPAPAPAGEPAPAPAPDATPPSPPPPAPKP